MNLDSLIFTLDDVRVVRKVSVNVDDFDLYARQAQAAYLQKILGDKLYGAMLANLTLGLPQDQRFKDLINGVTYTEGDETLFRGVQLYAVYTWLHLYLADSGLAITPIGSELFKDEQAERNEASTQIRNAKSHFISAADGLEDPILRYLDDHASTFPEFSESKRVEQASVDNMTFKVVGRRYSAPNNFIT